MDILHAIFALITLSGLGAIWCFTALALQVREDDRERRVVTAILRETETD